MVCSRQTNNVDGNSTTLTLFVWTWWGKHLQVMGDSEVTKQGLQGWTLPHGSCEGGGGGF